LGYNTVPLKPEDFNRGPILRRKLLDGTIDTNEASDLEKILENEKYMAINEGNMEILAAVNYFLNLLANTFPKKSTRRVKIKLPRHHSLEIGYV
jgi:hypothetical protein